MSSHHIVREKQEPALLIMELETFNEEHLGQLLEWAPTVMVPGNLVEKVISLGLKIDVVFSDDPNQFQENIRVLTAGDDILETALKFLVAEEYPAINIINNHFQEKDYLFYVDLIDIVVFANGHKIFPVRSGFSKWKAENEKLQIIHPEFIKELSFSGLDAISENTFSTQKAGFFSFTFNQPFIFIAEEL